MLLLLITFHFSFSQSEKTIKGTILNDGFSVQGVDVINFNNKKSTVTDDNGVFYISAKYNDILYFYSKKYLDKKIILNQKNIEEGAISIELILISIELNEVTVKKYSLPHISSNQAFNDQLKLEKQQKSLKNPNVYDGTIVNGMDFMRMGGDFIKLIKKVFKPKEKYPKVTTKIGFNDYVNLNFKEDFFIKELKLEPKQISSFIEFCNADSKSIPLMEDINILKTMDFLIVKNLEFKKIATSDE